MEQLAKELVKLRGETSKTYDLGKGKKRLITGGGIQHWKEDYSSKTEEWKECDLRWDGNRIDKAPYILARDGNKVTFTERKTWEQSSIELVSVKPSRLKFEIIPFESGVKFQHILPSDKVPFEAQFKVEGKMPVSRAYDDIGELELEVTYDEKTGILTERLTEIRSADSKELRQASGEIRIDPTLTVQPSSKDTFLSQSNPTTNYGTSTFLLVRSRDTNRNARSILEFPITWGDGAGQIPTTASITKAEQSLYVYTISDAAGRTHDSYRLTRTDWVEAQATWNIYKTGNNWTTAGGDYTDKDGSATVPSSIHTWMVWDVTNIVKHAQTNGINVEILVRNSVESQDSTSRIVGFRSKEYTTDTTERPKLVIEYTEAVTDNHRRSAFFPFM